MAKKRSNKISTIGSQISTVISVSLVLLIVGLILVITSLTGGAGDALRQRVALVVRLNDKATTDEINALNQEIKTQPYTSSVTYLSADEILRQEMEYNAELLKLLDDNPYSAEFEILLNPNYVNADSIVKISQHLEYCDTVEEVYSQLELINNVNSALRKIAIVLSVLGLVLLIISVVLLFNTISLGIYARRFVIHTMQLVGAKPSFIRLPFVRHGIMLGIMSGILASLMLIGLHLYAVNSQIDSLFFVNWMQTLYVCLIILIAGAMLCGIASWFATNRFIVASYDQLFKK